MRIFDLGLKKYGEEPEYCLAYVNFLTHLNGEYEALIIRFCRWEARETRIALGEEPFCQ